MCLTAVCSDVQTKSRGPTLHIQVLHFSVLSAICLDKMIITLRVYKKHSQAALKIVLELSLKHTTGSPKFELLPLLFCLILPLQKEIFNPLLLHNRAQSQKEERSMLLIF